MRVASRMAFLEDESMSLDGYHYVGTLKLK
jgi:hypothetical protein